MNHSFNRVPGNPSCFDRVKFDAPLAQLDRASGYEPEGREFESLRARHHSPVIRQLLGPLAEGARDFASRLPLRSRLLYGSTWCTGEDSNLRTSLGGTDLQSVGFNHSPTCANPETPFQPTPQHTGVIDPYRSSGNESGFLARQPLHSPENYWVECINRCAASGHPARPLLA